MTEIQKINILHLEDDELFVELVQGTLEQAEIPCKSHQVQSRDDYLSALTQMDIDIIFADYTLPSFDGLEALDIAIDQCPDIPFVFITGTLGEEKAIESLLKGAKDYILKQRLNRLVPAVKRVVNELKEQKLRQAAEQAIIESELRFRTVIDLLPDFIYVKDDKGRYQLANKSCAKAFGMHPKDIIGKTIFELYPNKDEALHHFQDDQEVIQSHQIKRISHEAFTNQDGSISILHTKKIPYSMKESSTGVLGISVDITDQLETETKLHESQVRLHLALTSSEIGIWDWNIPSNHIEWDDITHCIFGLQPGKFSGSYAEFEQLIHLNDRKRVKQEVETCIETKKEYVSDFRVYLPDQSIRWISSRGKVFYDENDKPYRMIGVNWDITESKQKDVQINQLYQAVNQSPVSIVITDNQGNIEYVNPVFNKLTGFTSSEILHQNPRILKSGIHSLEFYQKMWEEISSGNTWTGTMCNKKKDGTLYWESATIAPVKDQNGKIINYIALKEDITERRQIEEAYQVLVNQSIQGLLILQNNRVIFANPAFETMSGYSLQEMLNFNYEQIKSFIHQDDQEMVWSRHENRLKGNDEPTMYECRGVHKDGDLYWMRVYASLISYQGAPAIQVTTIDITESKILEESLRQVQKMESIGQLAGGVAHDFNNIIMAIKLNTEFAMMGLEEGSQIREDLNEVLVAAQRATALTRQLLAFSRKQVLDPKILNVNELIHNLDKMLSRLIGEHIEFVTKLDSSIGSIKADEGQIEQVIMNLVVNARDAIEDNGKICIETKCFELDENYSHNHVDIQPGIYVEVVVSDTGCGIKPEVMNKIFEPFFTTKGKGKGTGLGLSTVYGIVKQSGGSIYVYSEPAQGTSFKMFFPMVKDESQQIIEKITALIPKNTGSILVVEDDVSLQRVVVRILEENGFTVLTALNGKEALKLCETFQEPIHLVLTDTIMPEMNGKEMVDHLKILIPQVKVIFMSGYTDDIISNQGVLEEGIVLLQKPVTRSELLRRVHEILAS